jgi:hypothetical protein
VVLLFEYQSDIHVTQDRRNNLTLEGLMLSNQKNRNSRQYTQRCLDECIEAGNIMERVREGSLLGELFHTDSAHCDSAKVSHIVTSLTRRPNGYWGKAKLLESAGGLVARDLLSKGAHLG